MLEIATLKTYDEVNHRAGVQLAGSLTTYLDGVSVSVSIPPSALVTGNYVILAIPGGNPKDAVVIATWPEGSPGGGMEVHGNEYHGPDFAPDASVYKVVNAPVTYTIGSGQDYGTVAAAAAALRSLILEADITLKLMENVTETSLVEIIGQVSIGGMLRIELNGKTWTLSGDLFPKVFIGGLANVVFQTETASGGIIDIQHPSPSGKIPFRLRQMGFSRLSWTNPITINLNSLTFTAFMQLLDNSSGYAHDNVILQNYGSLTYTLRLDLLSRFTFNFAFPGPWLINGGGMILDQNGDIWTKKGKVT